MSTDTLNYGATVSRTLQPGSRAYSTILWQQGKPPLDAEETLQSDLQEEYRKRFNDNYMQSGFVNCHPLEYDASWPNYFKLPTDIAFVNGWQIDVEVGGNNEILLQTASTGLGNQRTDFVFLEVWKVLITGGSVDHKPSATEVYKDGNTQNTTTTVADDIVDTVIGFETTKRVQIQYRYRVQDGINTPNQQRSNSFDAATFAQGAMTSPVTPYVFTNQGSVSGDYGLYRAGNGDAASQLQLGTVDGYVYAIPVAIVSRRSIAPYNDEDSDGQLASNVNIVSGTSDRIDGLFYDSIAESDLIDVRHESVLEKACYKQLLETAIDDLLEGRNKQQSHPGIVYDLISDTSISGYTIINGTVADKVRSSWSDLQTTQVSYVAKLNIGDTDTNQDWYTDRATGSWASSDTVIVDTPNGAPSGTIISGTPLVFYSDKGLLSVAGVWTGTGTASATFTFGTNASLIAQEVWVVFDVQYPSNQGLSYVPDSLLKLEYKNAAAFPAVQTAYATYFGAVRAGTDLLSTDEFISRNSKQQSYTHDSTFNNLGTNYTLLQ